MIVLKPPRSNSQRRRDEAVEATPSRELSFCRSSDGQELVRKRQAYAPHGSGCLGSIDRPLLRLLDHEVRAEVLEGQAHRLLVGRRDRIDRDKEGDAYGDAEDIHQGPLMVVAKLVDDVAEVHGILTFCPLPD